MMLISSVCSSPKLPSSTVQAVNIYGHDSLEPLVNKSEFEIQGSRPSFGFSPKRVTLFNDMKSKLTNPLSN